MKNIRKRWAHHRNLLSRGHSEISLFYGVIQMALIFWLFLRDITTFSRVWMLVIIPVVVILATIIQYFIGWFMDRNGLIKDYQEWDTERNPIITAILKEVNDKH